MQTPSKFPIFNGKYEILSVFDETKAAKVYLARDSDRHESLVLLKIFKDEYLAVNLAQVETELQILSGLNHKNIVKLLSYGTDGEVVKPNGKRITDIVYSLLEHVNGRTLFEICFNYGKVREDLGRRFLTQMIEVLGYIHSMGAVHRNLKLENIYVDDHLNIKLFDFGYAACKDISSLASVRGTIPYMAPEVLDRQVHDGQKADIFSTGVILFILMQGIFPFHSSHPCDEYYKQIMNSNLNFFSQILKCPRISDELKDLLVGMMAYRPSDRFTLE